MVSVKGLGSGFKVWGLEMGCTLNFLTILSNGGTQEHHAEVLALLALILAPLGHTMWSHKQWLAR